MPARSNWFGTTWSLDSKPEDRSTPFETFPRASRGARWSFRDVLTPKAIPRKMLNCPSISLYIFLKFVLSY
jgi:hypothetical protein